jgi:hypothetical protein
MENRLTPDPITGAFTQKICGCCSELPTQHRCLAIVTTGGVLYGVQGGRVCGYPVCSPCSFKFGNEGVIRCRFHSSASNDEEVTDVEDCSDLSESGIEKENIPLSLPSVTEKKSCAKGKASKGFVSRIKPTTKVSAKGTRAAEYSAKDLLILSQSFVRCSENAIDGTSQKRNKFWDDVSATFNELKKQQEAFDSRRHKREKYNKVLLTACHAYRLWSAKASTTMVGLPSLP